MSLPLQKSLLYAGDRPELQRLEGLVTRVLLASPPVVSLPSSYVLQHREDCVSEALLALLSENPSEFEEYNGRILFGTNACCKRAVQRYVYHNFAKVDLTAIPLSNAENLAGTSPDPLAATIAKDRLGTLYQSVEDYCNTGAGYRRSAGYRRILLKAVAVEGGAADSPPASSATEYRQMLRARERVQELAADILATEGEDLKRLLSREMPPYGGALYRQAKSGRFANPVQVLTG